MNIHTFAANATEIKYAQIELINETKAGIGNPAESIKTMTSLNTSKLLSKNNRKNSFEFGLTTRCSHSMKKIN